MPLKNSLWSYLFPSSVKILLFVICNKMSPSVFLIGEREKIQDLSKAMMALLEFQKKRLFLLKTIKIINFIKLFNF